MPKSTAAGRLVDVRPDRLDLRDREYRPPLCNLPPEYPDPDRVIPLLPRYEALILDQGQEGACTGFGLAAVINFLFWREWLRQCDSGLDPAPPQQVSPSMLYNMARVYDEWPGENYEGSSCRGAMKGWHRHGVCSARLWRYRDRARRARVDLKPASGWIADAARRTIGAYYRVDKGSVTDLQAAIHEVGAVYVSAEVHDGWTLDKSKTLPVIAAPSGETGGHAFALVGYNRDGFIVQNSWGPEWGFHGFAVLPYADWVQNAMDAWVAVLGPPVKLDDPTADTTTRRARSLRESAASRATVALGRAVKQRDYVYRHPRLRPLDEEQGYRHTVVLGNDGQPLKRLLGPRTAEEAIDEVALRLPRKWISGRSAAGPARIVVYAHGGLNDEDVSLARVRVLAPHFEANGAYPLFLTWRTGLVESLVGLMKDGVKRAIFGEQARGAFSDLWEKVTDVAAEARDRSVEVVCENLLVKAIWTQMKQNAEASQWPGSGGRRFTDNLARLQREQERLEIHLVGHSAGSIILGYMLDRLASKKARVKTLTLYAPACTSGFANRHFVNAVRKKVLETTDMHFEMLDDERERAGSVGPYGKSLLYLVSRALESVHKMPILGMANAWDAEAAKTRDLFHPRHRKDVLDWLRFARTIKPVYHGKDRARVSNGVEMIDLAHGSFDNDVEVIQRTIARIVGRVRYPVENLRGY